MDQRVLAANMKAHAALGGKPPEFEKALIDRAGLNAEEARLAGMFQWSNWQINAHLIRSRDVFRPDDQLAFQANLRRQYAESPVGRMWYQLTKASVANPSLLRYVDSALTEAGQPALSS